MSETYGNEQVINDFTGTQHIKIGSINPIRKIIGAQRCMDFVSAFHNNVNEIDIAPKKYDICDHCKKFMTKGRSYVNFNGKIYNCCAQCYQQKRERSLLSAPSRIY